MSSGLITTLSSLGTAASATNLLVAARVYNCFRAFANAETAVMALAEYQHQLSASFPESLQAVFDSDAVTYAVESEVDARSSPCPMPLLKAKQALRTMQANQFLRVVASDSGSLKDFVSFALIAQHKITHFYADELYFYYVLQKSPN